MGGLPWPDNGSTRADASSRTGWQPIGSTDGVSSVATGVMIVAFRVRSRRGDMRHEALDGCSHTG